MKSREVFEFGAKHVYECKVSGCKRVYFHAADLTTHAARHQQR